MVMPSITKVAGARCNCGVGAMALGDVEIIGGDEPVEAEPVEHAPPRGLSRFQRHGAPSRCGPAGPGYGECHAGYAIPGWI